VLDLFYVCILKIKEDGRCNLIILGFSYSFNGHWIYYIAPSRIFA